MLRTLRNTVERGGCDSSGWALRGAGWTVSARFQSGSGEEQCHGFEIFTPESTFDLAAASKPE